ncbi:serine hydrolase domain-containing protein [Thermoflexibacter ruber]|uniref:CubicO group peptidase, beta-lactamase class C family n=1 Tax=Thermoflexibacter ruber TaxID=1003 RepID=A0A1I2DY31_9BACT|nr:serine hydrolase [Thermoflexibacter ruber]SFE85143.1 CubicO group peptidase, beta-lactamase class C family [Thermoflexibacter ruber]
MRKQLLFLATWIFSLLLLGESHAQSSTKPQQLILAKSPESVGVSSAQLQKAEAMLLQKIANKKIAGAVALIARKGQIVYHKALGMNDIENNKPMKTDNIFRIMSMSKAVTSVAIMMLYEEGKFMLDDPISKFIPEFKNPKILVEVNKKDSSYAAKSASKEITIRHLLTHTAGIPYENEVYAKNKIPRFYSTENIKLSEVIPKLAKLPILHEPGEQFTYGLNTDILGYLVEVISGKTLAQFFQERIFEPLGMTDTYFFLPESKYDRLVAVYEEVGEKEGITRKPTSHWTEYPISGAKTYFSGGAGLSSTAMDYAKLCQMLLNGGTFNNKRILGRKTVELMTTNQIGNLEVWDRGNKFGLGFEIVSEKGHAKIPSSVGAFEWGGMYYTHYWIDPKEDLVGVVLFQVFPTKGWGIENQFKAMIYQALD